MKILTPENWQDKDPACDSYLFLDHETGESGPLFPDYWLKLIFESQLTGGVPDDVRKLFEVARATMLYGYFYYPLFNLGMEQFHRVAEAAISAKYLIAGGPEKTNKGLNQPFSAKIKWLRNHGLLTEDEFEEWEWVRRARNSGSHLSRASVYPPVPATMALKETADRINRLFAE